jgi:hypothetical protein
MARAELSRRVEKVVTYPPQCDMGETQRRGSMRRCSTPTASKARRPAQTWRFSPRTNDCEYGVGGRFVEKEHSEGVLLLLVLGGGLVGEG